MTRLKLNLAENAFDFFSEAIEYIERDDTHRLKYAILHMTSAAELILKARLAKEHWALIFKNPSEADLDKFEKHEYFRSVDFQDAQDRIERICKIDLSKHKPVLEKLRRMRNSIQHFAFSGEVPEIVSILNKTWSFLWDFIHDHMPDEAEDEKEILDSIRVQMSKHGSYVEHRLKEVTPNLETLKEKDINIISCSSCLQDTLVIPGGSDPNCLFCRYQDEAEKVADDWATVFVGYPHTDPKECDIEPVLKECSECGKETMIEFEDGSMTPPDPAWICFSCGESGPPMVTCHSCGEEFPWEGEIYICQECREEGMKQ